jgi:hypothetical protein
MTSVWNRTLTILLEQNGGAGRDRTDDLKLAKLPLSQLSYGPVIFCIAKIYRPAVVWNKPREVKVSNQNSQLTPTAAHSQSEWWAWEDLNFRPHAYQARALTN